MAANKLPPFPPPSTSRWEYVSNVSLSKVTPESSWYYTCVPFLLGGEWHCESEPYFPGQPVRKS